jgi:hypothetical protein
MAKLEIDVNDQGSLVILNPLTDRADTWLAENLDPDGMKWCGGYVCEPRYVGAILEGAIEEGLVS